MSGSFGAAAARLCAIAAQALGWRPDEFWRATPAELNSALAPPRDDSEGVTRMDLNRLMDQENG